MSSTKTLPFLPPLSDHQRDEIGRELQETLVELLDLSLVGKQLHWTVTGPLFRPVHAHLDELVDSWRELADTVAERAVALGYWPDGQAGAIAAVKELPKVDRGPMEDKVVLRELARFLAESVERIREHMDRVGNIDVASQDVLIQVVLELEKQLWMTRSHLA